MTIPHKKIFLFFVATVLAVACLVATADAASKLVVLNESHSASSSGFVLTTYIPISGLNTSIQAHSTNSSTFYSHVVANPPVHNQTTLSTSLEHHTVNSACFNLRTYEMHGNLSTTIQSHSTSSSTFTSNVIANPPVYNQTTLSTSIQSHTTNSSYFKLSPHETVTKLNVSLQSHTINSSGFSSKIPVQPHEPHKLNTSVQSHSINSSYLVVNVPYVPPTIADLTVTDISWTPTTLIDGAEITLIGTVKNNGTTSTVRSFYVAFYINDNFIGESNVRPLAGGDSTVVTQSWIVEPGNYTVRIKADHRDFINELNEYNNERVAALPFIEQADIVVSDIVWAPANISDGDDVTFTANLTNIGTGSTYRQYCVYFYVDGTYTGRKSLNGLSAGSSANVTQNWIATPGSHTIEVRADYDNDVSESNETNNAKNSSVPHIDYPDIIVADIAWTPDIISVGDSVTFNATIKNNGPGNTNRTFSIQFYINGSLIGAKSVSGLSAGGSVYVTETWLATPGNDSVSVYADAHNIVPESNESNNERTEQFFNVTQADIIVADIVWVPATINDGDAVTFTATIKNNGTGNTSVSFYNTFFIDGGSIGGEWVNGLSAGDSINVTQIWTATHGNHTIKVMGDANGDVSELNEINNERAELVPGIAQADIVVANISWSPATINEGDTVTFTATIKNNGSGSTSGTFYNAFFIDVFSIGGEWVDGLSAGDSINISQTWVATPGSPTINVIADANNHISESNETNNERSVPLYGIEQADLVVTNITWTPLTFTDGDTVTFTATIGNNGTGSSSKRFYNTFYIDGSSIGGEWVNGLSAGNSTNLTQTWTVSPGSYTIKVTADANNDVSESNESNNEKVIPLTDIEYPDFTVTNLSWSPLSYNYKDTVNLNADVKNIRGSTIKSFRVTFYINGKAIGYQNINGLDTNESVNITGYWTAIASEAVYELRVDSFDCIPEHDETNNVKNITLPYIQCPDLTVTDIRWLPESPNGNQPTTIAATIQNDNVGNITKTFMVSYYVDNNSIGYGTVSGMQANDVIEVASNWIAVAGEHTITVKVDWYEDSVSYCDLIGESNESNNEFSTVITVEPPLNVLTLNKVAVQEACNVNSTETAYFEVNDEYGNYVSADSVYAEVEKPDSSTDTVNLTCAGVGRYKLTYEDTTQLGQYNLKVYAVKENYTSDFVTAAFNVDDLTAPGIKIVSPTKGSVVEGLVTIQVEANDALSGVSSVEVKIDNYAYQSCVKDTLWTCTWNSTIYPHGLHTITARATDSKGNVGTTSIVVDVFKEYTDFTISPGSYNLKIHPGESTSQVFMIENTGTVSIAEIDVSSSLDWVAVNTTSLQTPLDIGETTTFTLTASIPSISELPPSCKNGCILGGHLTITADNVSKYPSQSLDVVLPDITFGVSPTSWNLGVIPPGYTTPPKVFTVTNNWDKTISVDIVIPPGAPLNLDTSGFNSTLSPGETTNFSMTLTTADNMPSSSFNGMFAIQVNDTELNNHKIVNIRGTVRTPLTATPSNWKAGFMNPNTTLAKTFTIINTGIADVKDVTVRAEGDLATYLSFDTHQNLGDLAVGENTSFAATLNISADASEGFYRGKIVVSTEKSGSIVIPVVVDITNNRLGYMTFNIVDNTTQEPIRNAIVALTGDNGSYVTRTDSNGTANFTVWSGGYNYETGADEYLSKSGNIDIPPGDPETTIELHPKPIISVEVQILDEHGNFLPIDEETGLPVVQAEQTYHFKMTIIVNTGETVDEGNFYIPPEFTPPVPGDYTITRQGDTYTVDWDFYPSSGFSWPSNDNFAVGNANYRRFANPRGKVPMEIEGDMHFGGEKFMVRAIIKNLEEDQNDPTAIPADAIDVKATLQRPVGIVLLPEQSDTVEVGDILIGESETVSWLVKATGVGIHEICVLVTDVYNHEWVGCAKVKAIEPATVNVKYCIPPNVEAGKAFTLFADITNPTELTAKDFSIVFTSFNENIKLAAGETADKYVGDISPQETKTVSWSVVPLVTGFVEDVIFETFYENGPTLSYEIGGICGGGELPDLTLSPGDITFSNSMPAVGEAVTITAAIHNIGNADATNVVVQFFDGDPTTNGLLIETDQIIDLIIAGGNKYVSVIWTAGTYGSAHDIYVKIDPYDNIVELNENNNEAHELIIVGCTKDVIAKKILLLHLNYVWNYDFYERYYDYDDNAIAPDPIKDSEGCTIPIEEDDIWITRFSTYSPGFYPASAALMGPVIGFDTNSWYNWGTPVKGITYPELEIKSIDEWVSSVPFIGEDLEELLGGLLTASEFSIKLDGIYADAPIEWNDKTNESWIPLKFSGKAIGPGIEEGLDCESNFKKIYDIDNGEFRDNFDNIVCRVGIGLPLKEIGYNKTKDINAGVVEFNGTVMLECELSPSANVGTRIKIDPITKIEAGKGALNAQLNAGVEGNLLIRLPWPLDDINLSINSSLPTPSLANPVTLIGEVVIPIQDYKSGDYIESVYTNFSGNYYRYEDLDALAPVLRMNAYPIVVDYTMYFNLTELGVPCGGYLPLPCELCLFDGTLFATDEWEDYWSFNILTIHSPVDVHVYDSIGRHIGLNATNGVVDLEIPNSTYVLNGSAKTLMFPTTTDKFIVLLNGTDAGAYNMSIYRPILISGVNNTNIIKGVTYQSGNISTKMGKEDYFNINFDEIEKQTNEKVHSGKNVTEAIKDAIRLIILEENVTKHPTSLFISDVFGANDDPVILYAKLMSLDKPLANRTILFEIDGNIVGQAITDVNGNGTLSYTIPKNMKVGTHNISTIYHGDDIYSGGDGSATLTVLNQPPEVELYLPSYIVSGILLINGTFTDTNLEKIILKIDNESVAGSIPYLWDSTNYTDGLHLIQLIAIDNFGEVGQSMAFVIVNNALPTITLTSPVNNTTYPTNSVNLNYTVNESTVGEGYSLDGAENVTLEGNTTLTNLTEGVHTLTVYANDTAGNMYSSTVWFTIDTTPPESISDLQYVSGDTWINWTWTNPPDPDFNHTEIWLNNEFKTNITTPEYSYNAIGLNPNTTYEIGTRTVDESGNINQTWMNDTTKTLLTPDITPPILTNVTATTITTNSATITWDTDEPSDSRVKYGTESGNYTLQKYDLNNVISHTINLTALASNTTYYYLVNSTDASGNTNESVEYSFTTALTTDTIPPESISNLGEIAKGNTWINWNWTNPPDPDFNHTEIWLNNEFKTNITTPEHSYNATGLTPNTTYEISTRTVDESGNINQTWMNDTATTLLTPDITPPILTNVTATTITTNSATITWDTDEPSDSRVNYGTESGNYTLQVHNTTNILSHSIKLIGLIANTIYYYVVNSTDLAGNTHESAEYDFSTTSVIDTKPPASVTNLQNSTGQTWINWIWTNPPDTDFNHTIVYLNGTRLANTSDNYYNATGLTPATSYNIGTQTVDTTGNVNTSWVNQTTITQAGIDTTPPSVTNTTATPASIVADGIQESQLNVTVTDESGIASVTVDLSDIGGSPVQQMDKIPDTDVYTVNTTAAAGTVPDTYDLPVNATDSYSNSNTSVSIALTLTEAGDTISPTIESVTLDAYTVPPDSTIHVTVEATDNVGVSLVTADGVNLVETESIWDGDITAPSATGDYTLQIRAEDAAGNPAETTVEYSVVNPSGSIGIGVDPRLTTITAGDTANINLKLVSTENFDDIAYVYLTTEGVYSGYEANLTWFNGTSQYVEVPAGTVVNVPLEVSIPPGESGGYKVFYAKLESTKWTPTAVDTGILYMI